MTRVSLCKYLVLMFAIKWGWYSLNRCNYYKKVPFFTNANIYITMVLKWFGLLHQKGVKCSSGITLCKMHFSSFQGPNILNATFPFAFFPQWKEDNWGMCKCLPSGLGEAGRCGSRVQVPSWPQPPTGSTFFLLSSWRTLPQFPLSRVSALLRYS